MKFSVLLSVYRKEQPAYLRQSLDSIFTQTLLPDEVVLVKDGPLTDALDEVAEDYCRKYPVIRVVPLSENQGLGRALNEGLKHCSYDLVARMDTDDVAKPERFEKQIAVFCAHPEMDVVGAWIDEFEGDIGNVISVRKLPVPQAGSRKRLSIRSVSCFTRSHIAFTSRSAVKTSPCSVTRCLDFICCCTLFLLHR